MNSQLAQQVREMQQRVVQLEQERLSAQSRTDTEKELQLQVGGLTKAAKIDVSHNMRHCVNFIPVILRCMYVQVTDLKAELRAVAKSREDLTDTHKKEVSGMHSLL